MSLNTHTKEEAILVLVVEDDKNLRVAVCENLEAEGYDVMSTGLGDKASEYVEKYEFQLIVLDITLPDTNGFDLCKKWRNNNCKSMILMLTAKDAEDDMLAGFAAGADDYIVKPYPLKVFLSRVQALLRRLTSSSQEETTSQLELDGYQINTIARKITDDISNEEIELTKIEYDLLIHFVTNNNRALSYDEIIKEVWGKNIYVVHGAIRNTVSSLRKKLQLDSNRYNWNIATIRGIGYRMELLI